MYKNILEPILTTIENNVNNLETETKLKMSRKLSKLYKAPVVLPDHEVDAFIKLSCYTLTEHEKSLLNLGINCHLQSSVNKYDRKVELEILYESLLKLQTQKIVDISPDLQDQLRAVGSQKSHNSKSSFHIVRKLTQAANTENC